MKVFVRSFEQNYKISIVRFVELLPPSIEYLCWTKLFEVTSMTLKYCMCSKQCIFSVLMQCTSFQTAVIIIGGYKLRKVVCHILHLYYKTLLPHIIYVASKTNWPLSRQTSWHSIAGKNTGVTDNIKYNCIIFRWATSRALVLCIVHTSSLS